MLKPCPFHTLFTLCKLKKLLCPSKKPAGTPYQYDQIHICFCLWPFLDPSTYIIATIVFLRYRRHWPSFSFIAIWYQMILQVVNTSSQWVENISEGASILYSCLTSFHGIFNFNTFIAISMIGTKQSIPVGQTLSQIWRQGRFRT